MTLPNYDRWALDAGEAHECTRLRVRCTSCGSHTLFREPIQLGDEHCANCDRLVTDEDLTRAECACERDDDEREERQS